MVILDLLAHVPSSGVPVSCLSACVFSRVASSQPQNVYAVQEVEILFGGEMPGSV